MRAPLVALLLLLAPLAAGCLNLEEVETAATEGRLDPAQVIVPEGARVEPVPGRPEAVQLVWEGVELPFEQTFDLPPGTTLVRATTTLGESDLPVYVGLHHADTDRRRCQVPYTVSWTEPTRGSMTCIGLAAIDPPGTTWKVSAGGYADVADVVKLEFLAVPLEGPAAQLDLSQLSMPTHALTETEIQRIESFDGTELHVEVTRPAVDAPVPAVIVSSPYNDATRKAGNRPSDDLIKDWGARGYAIVVADVRGYGESDGCVEVWSENEQKDQKALVEWVAAQTWSDGNVGFYGQSYVGTTPVAAAVQAPEALKAIVTVAPVINAYDDWHFGGVPNGENAFSPVGYQTLGAHLGFGVPPRLQEDTHDRVDNGFCDPGLTARANDPRAVYDAFYEERNFSLRAKDVTAAVLYTHGFEDSNVKSSMTQWFNDIEAPKLGLFGHWVHQHPPRADQEVLFLAWMDQYVKGRPLGFENVQAAHVITNADTARAYDAWPPTNATDVTYHLDFDGDALSPEPKDGEAILYLDSTQAIGALPVRTLVPLDAMVDEPVQLAGTARVELKATLEGAQNGYVAAFLYDGDTLVTWGMFNLAHRNGHDTYEPVQPGETLRVSIPMLPTEHVFEAGDTLHLEIRGARVADWALVNPGDPARLVMMGGDDDGTRLVLPTTPVGEPVGPVLDWTPGPVNV